MLIRWGGGPGFPCMEHGAPDAHSNSAADGKWLGGEDGQEFHCVMEASSQPPHEDKIRLPLPTVTYVFGLPYIGQAPVPLSIFRSNSKFDENWERSSFEYTQPITTIFCTRHDSDTVVTCSKYRCDRSRIFYTTVFWIFIEICLVGRAPQYIVYTWRWDLASKCQRYRCISVVPNWNNRHRKWNLWHRGLFWTSGSTSSPDTNSRTLVLPMLTRSRIPFMLDFQRISFSCSSSSNSKMMTMS